MLNFLVLVMLLPTRSPIGVMESSAPNVKNIIPAIKNTAPSKNASKILGDTGAIVKHKSNTIPRIGRTAFKASFNFSCNFVL